MSRFEALKIDAAGLKKVVIVAVALMLGGTLVVSWIRWVTRTSDGPPPGVIEERQRKPQAGDMPEELRMNSADVLREQEEARQRREKAKQKPPEQKAPEPDKKTVETLNKLAPPPKFEGAPGKDEEARKQLRQQALAAPSKINMGNRQGGQAGAGGAQGVAQGMQERTQSITSAMERIQDKAMAGQAGMMQAQDPYKTQNSQDEKRNFLRSSGDEGSTTNKYLLEKNGQFSLLAGSVIPAVLITPIDSDLPGTILALVNQDVYDSATGRYLLVPKGTRLVGDYDSRVMFGQERVLFAWTRLIFPQNGTSMVLERYPGVDQQGQSGMTGDVNNHWMRIIAATLVSAFGNVGTSFLGGGGLMGQISQQNILQAYAGQAGQGLNQAGQQITSKSIQIQPTIKVPKGVVFNVIVKKDLIFPGEYKG